MTNDKLKEITGKVADVIKEGSFIFEGTSDYDKDELLDIIASLHNELYKEVTGEYYDYMFHWANHGYGGVIDDGLFKENNNGSGEETEQTLDLAIKALEEQPTGKWIPVKYRPLNVDERKEFAEHYGSEYSDEIDEKVFDCPMPEDGQEILVSSSWGVREDIAENDALLNGFNTYGLEGNGDWEGIDAWMPMPEPYKKGEEE